jgi:hypothetical protein
LRNPIPLPRGRYLVTLDYAGRYITRLPWAEHEAARWQIAKQVAERALTRGVGARAAPGHSTALGRIAPRRSTVLAPRHAHEASWCPVAAAILSTVNPPFRHRRAARSGVGEKPAGKPDLRPAAKAATDPEAAAKACSPLLHLATPCRDTALRPCARSQYAAQKPSSLCL